MLFFLNYIYTREREVFFATPRQLFARFQWSSVIDPTIDESPANCWLHQFVGATPLMDGNFVNEAFALDNNKRKVFITCIIYCSTLLFGTRWPGKRRIANKTHLLLSELYPIERGVCLNYTDRTTRNTSLPFRVATLPPEWEAQLQYHNPCSQKRGIIRKSYITSRNEKGTRNCDRRRWPFDHHYHLFLVHRRLCCEAMNEARSMNGLYTQWCQEIETKCPPPGTLGLLIRTGQWDSNFSHFVWVDYYRGTPLSLFFAVHHPVIITSGWPPQSIREENQCSIESRWWYGWQ